MTINFIAFMFVSAAVKSAVGHPVLSAWEAVIFVLGLMGVACVTFPFVKLQLASRVFGLKADEAGI